MTDLHDLSAEWWLITSHRSRCWW